MIRAAYLLVAAALRAVPISVIAIPETARGAVATAAAIEK